MAYLGGVMKKNGLILCVMLLLVSFAGCRMDDEAKRREDVTNPTVTPVPTATPEPTATPALTTTPEPTEEKNEVPSQRVLPLENTLTIDEMTDVSFSGSLQEGDAYVDDTGVMRMDVTVYAYDLYDMVDISLLKAGDTIVIRNREVVVTSLEQNGSGAVAINGGFDNSGYDLYTDENGVWFEWENNDNKVYYEVGKVSLRVSDEFELYDSSDLDKGETTYYSGDFLTTEAGIVYNFIPENTEFVVEDGVITKMYRRYIP